MRSLISGISRPGRRQQPSALTGKQALVVTIAHARENYEGFSFLYFLIDTPHFELYGSEEKFLEEEEMSKATDERGLLINSFTKPDQLLELYIGEVYFTSSIKEVPLGCACGLTTMLISDLAKTVDGITFNNPKIPLIRITWFKVDAQKSERFEKNPPYIFIRNKGSKGISLGSLMDPKLAITVNSLKIMGDLESGP